MGYEVNPNGSTITFFNFQRAKKIIHPEIKIFKSTLVS